MLDFFQLVTCPMIVRLTSNAALCWLAFTELDWFCPIFTDVTFGALQLSSCAWFSGPGWNFRWMRANSKDESSSELVHIRICPPSTVAVWQHRQLLKARTLLTSFKVQLLNWALGIEPSVEYFGAPCSMIWWLAQGCGQWNQACPRTKFGPCRISKIFRAKLCPRTGTFPASLGSRAVEFEAFGELKRFNMLNNSDAGHDCVFAFVACAMCLEVLWRHFTECCGSIL